MTFIRKKRWYAILLVTVIVILYLNTDRIGKWIYPISYEKDIQASAASHEVDPYLVASVIRVESRFNPDLRSRKGAVGLMQVMPDTADWISKTAGYSEQVERRLSEPSVNIEVGSWYIRSIYEQFGIPTDRALNDDQISLIAAAYNAGPGNVTKWLDQGVWKGTYADLNNIPFGETRHYVQRIVYYYKKYIRFYDDLFGERRA